jgi:hypothetical protein
MTRVYGRIIDRRTGTGVRCDVVFEPRSLGYMDRGVLMAFPGYLAELDDDGDFILDIEPGVYLVCMEDTRLGIEVPDTQQITLKELVENQFRS